MLSFIKEHLAQIIAVLTMLFAGIAAIAATWTAWVSHISIRRRVFVGSLVRSDIIVLDIKADTPLTVHWVKSLNPAVSLRMDGTNHAFQQYVYPDLVVTYFGETHREIKLNFLGDLAPENRWCSIPRKRTMLKLAFSFTDQKQKKRAIKVAI